MIKKKPLHLTRLEPVIILLLGILLVGGTLYRTGTISSGYHFQDDHELIRYHVAFTEGNASLADLIGTAIAGDSTRFRPMYWVERLTGIMLFGDEMVYWNWYTAFKGILTFYLLYYTARYLVRSRFISFLFTGITLFGAQFTPWYRSANQENTGLLFCALTLFLIAKQYHDKKYENLLMNILIPLSAVICGLIKESFTLFMPVFAALKFWLEYCENGECYKCFKRNLNVSIIILLSAAVNAGIILFHTGVDNVSYAGFQKGTSLLEYWSGIKYSLNFNLRSYTLAGAALFFAIVMFFHQLSKADQRKYAGFILIALYVMVVQLVVHAKSLMSERYIIPWIVGYTFLIVLLGYQLFRQDRWKKTLYIGILILLFLSEAPRAWSMSREYAYTGSMVRLYFQNILDKTSEDSHIVCAFYDPEVNIASECWLETHGRTLVYSFDTASEEFVNLSQLKMPSPEIFSWETATVITCYTSQAEQILQSVGISDPDQYDLSEHGIYCVISRKAARQ